MIALLVVTAPASTDPPESAPSPCESQAVTPPPPHGVGEDEITPSDAAAIRELRRSPAGLRIIGLEVGDTRYAVELATTEASRARGMGGRRTFPPGTAMLFVNPNDIVRRYWMLECSVDIDVAFIDRFGRITAMHRMKAAAPRKPGESLDRYTARLHRYSSRRPARYALELPAGELSRLGLKVGGTIPLPHQPLQALARR
ncbi:MAG: hypothetical protein CMJ34_01085 [Phycisphaerae bacterium]|nr:hypothetical protein [Phycisphaerae bacterium]